MLGVCIKLLLYPELDWAPSFMLGAIVSATDPVAVVALLKSLGASTKFQIVIDAPPEKMWEEWKKSRIDYYRRFEPSAPVRDEPLGPPKGAKRLRLTGQASTQLWMGALAGTDEKSKRAMAEAFREYRQRMGAFPELPGQHRRQHEQASASTAAAWGAGPAPIFVRAQD